MNKNNYSIISKVFILILIIPFFIYSILLRRIINVYDDNKGIEYLINKSQEKDNKKNLKIYTTSTKMSNGKIVSDLTKYIELERMKNTEIINFQPVIIDSIRNYKLYAGKLDVKGDSFIELVKLLYFSEIANYKIISCKFFLQKKREYKAKENLYLSIISTQIEVSENESPALSYN